MTSALAITDFPDRLSPMVVKELRQGMRTRLFGGVMLTLHVLLILFTLMSGGAQNASVVSDWFDGIITLVLCIIIPLRGFSAVADELKAGTLDMLVLTSLSAGRIIFGKWAAIASQSLLIALSVLPYVVARFVFGGLDLFEEIAVLFYKWVIGIVLAAVIVALSTQRQFWLRAVVVGLPLLIGGCGAASFFMISRMSRGLSSSTAVFSVISTSGSSGESGVISLLVGLAAWTIFFFLSLAATRIAPASSLLSVVKRSVHLVVLLLLILLGWFTGLSGPLAIITSTVLSLIMVDALTERVNEIPSVYAAFYRRGLPGRVALWLFAPGWVTGFVYTVLITSLFALQVGFTRSLAEAQLVGVSAASTWLIAVLVQLFSTRNARDLLPPFLIFWLMASVLIMLFGGLLLQPFVLKGGTAWFACALPELVPMGYATAQAADKSAFLEFGSCAALFWPVLLFFLAVFAWRHTRAARQEAWRMVHGLKGGAAS
ncbi:hypothetical protein [Prosthecobacter sp.]|uniref:hypothetical protein n=1 Tax=Prosthecobacter sp. TaxID=1965333 RepID=UPI0037843AEA